jgi:hypothetical protein
MGLEQTSLAQALILALGGTVPGFGVAYALFYWAIGRKYGSIKGLSSHAKIKYWCGLAATIFFGLGISTVLNELLSAYFNNKEIEIPAIERGIFTAIAPGLVLLVFSVILVKAKRNKITPLQPQNEDKNSKAVNFERGVSSKRGLIAFIAFAALAILIMQFPWLTHTSRRAIGEFSLTDCQCVKGKNCASADIPMYGFKVEPPDVYVFYKVDGKDRILKYPTDDKMKCVIVKDRNFAFDCSRVSSNDPIYSTTTVLFDGKNSYDYEYSMTILHNGESKTVDESKIGCTVK